MREKDVSETSLTLTQSSTCIIILLLVFSFAKQTTKYSEWEVTVSVVEENGVSIPCPQDTVLLVYVTLFLLSYQSDGAVQNHLAPFHVWHQLRCRFCNFFLPFRKNSKLFDISSVSYVKFGIMVDSRSPSSTSLLGRTNQTISSRQKNVYLQESYSLHRWCTH